MQSSQIKEEGRKEVAQPTKLQSSLSRWQLPSTGKWRISPSQNFKISGRNQTSAFSQGDGYQGNAGTLQQLLPTGLPTIQAHLSFFRLKKQQLYSQKHSIPYLRRFSAVSPKNGSKQLPNTVMSNKSLVSAIFRDNLYLQLASLASPVQPHFRQLNLTGQ